MPGLRTLPGFGTVITWRGEEWVLAGFTPARGPFGALNHWHSRDSFTATSSPDGWAPLGATIVKPGDGSTLGLVAARGTRSIVA